MPNGHDYGKEYGRHSYREEGTSDCKYGCGCWAGDANSGGPVGLDPLSGECPNNPKDGKRIGGTADYEIVVTRRIRALEGRMYVGEQAQEKLGRIKNTPKGKLAQEVEDLRKKLAEDKKFFEELEKKIPRLLVR